MIFLGIILFMLCVISHLMYVNFTIYFGKVNSILNKCLFRWNRPPVPRITVQVTRGKRRCAITCHLGGNIDFALLDIDLPDMTAIEVYRAIMEAHPGLAVLVSTGFEPKRHARDILAAAAQGFIQKSYTLEALPRNWRSCWGDEQKSRSPLVAWMS